MNVFKLLILLILICISYSRVFAEEDLLTANQQEQLLERLEELESAASEIRNSVYSKALVELKAVVGQPSLCGRLYIDCVNEVDFKAKGRKFGEFSEWKKRYAKQVGESDYEKALQLQVRYIIMTMNLFHLEEWEQIEHLIGSLLEYLDHVADADAVRGTNNRPVLNSPLNQSYFVKRFKLEKSLKPRLGWVMNAGDINGIYDKFILPNVIRQKKEGLLDQVWQRRVKQAREIADKNDSKDEFDRFGIPALEWKKANNLYAMGKRRSAFLKMLNIIKAHTDHPEALKWIGEFKKLIAASATPEEGEGDDFF